MLSGDELSDEVLELISGGMTGEQEEALHRALVLLKQNGTSKRTAMTIFAATEDPALADECIEYIRANWDLI